MSQFHGLAVPFNRVGVMHYHCSGRLLPTRVCPGAFARSIAAGRVVAQIGHRTEHVFARQSDGTLWLTETAEGLVFVAHADERWASELGHAADTGAINGVSPGWAPNYQFALDGDVRVVSDCNLVEISILLGRQVPAFVTTWARRFRG